jgi:methionine synthase II (cobalamin-independent)
MKFKEARTNRRGEKVNMKRYEDFEDKKGEYVSKDVKWTKFKIVVPTEEDRQEIMEACQHLHDADIDTEYVTVNQLVHEYGPLYYKEGQKSIENDPKNYNIVVDEELYERLNKSE